MMLPTCILHIKSICKLLVFMPQTLKKLVGHIAFGLSVHACVTFLYVFVNF